MNTFYIKMIYWRNLNSFTLFILYFLRNIQSNNNEKLIKIKFNKTNYRNAIGNLLYKTICTRSDILFSVRQQEIQMILL